MLHAPRNTNLDLNNNNNNFRLFNGYFIVESAGKNLMLDGSDGVCGEACGVCWPNRSSYTRDREFTSLPHTIAPFLFTQVGHTHREVDKN